MSNDTDCFFSALTSAGLSPESFAPVADGKIHRFRDMNLDKPDKRNGWYVLHNLNGFIAGAFGHWKKGKTENFTSRQQHTFNQDERSAFKAKMEAVQTQIEAEQTRVHAECRERAEKLWTARQPAKKKPPIPPEKECGRFRHPGGWRTAFNSRARYDRHPARPAENRARR